MQPVGEWIPDQAEVMLPGVRIADNVVATSNGYTSMHGLSAVDLDTADVISDTVRGYGNGRLSAGGGTQWMAAGTSSNAYLSRNGQPFTDVTPTMTALSDSGRWTFSQYEPPSGTPPGLILATPGVGNGAVYTTNAGAAFLPILNNTLTTGSVSVPSANVSMIFRGFYVLGDIDLSAAYGRQEGGLHWSAQGNPLLWPLVGTAAATDVLSDFQVLQGSGGRITALVPSREYALVFREREVWRMDFVGGSNIFEFRKVDSHRGCIATGGAISVGGLTYFPSEAGWMSCDGASVRPIGLEKIDRFWRDEVGTDMESVTNVTSVAYDPERRTIWWNFPGVGPGRVYGYHADLQRWTRLTVTLDWIGTTIPITADTMDTNKTTDPVPGDYGSRNMDSTVAPNLGSVVLNTLTQTGVDEILIGFPQADHQPYGFTNSGAPLQGKIGGGDFADQASSARVLLRNVRPVFGSVSDPSDIQMSVEARLLPGKAPSEMAKITGINTLGRIPYRIQGRYLRPFFFFNGFVTQFRGFEPVVVSGGTR